MGTIIHKTLIVTGPRSWVGDTPSTLEIFHAKTLRAHRKKTSALIKHEINGEATFMVVSSGSKLGWSESTEHDLLLDDLVAEAEELHIDAIIVEHGETEPMVVTR